MPSLFDLSGRVALVTGGSRGLGAAIAIALAGAGASVILWARHQPSLEQVAQRIRAIGRHAWTDLVDVTDAIGVRRALRRAIGRAGRLDILVNNAGIWDGDPVVDLRASQWAKVVETNLTSVFFVTQAVLPHMIRQGSGKVIHISSTSGILAHRDGAAYGATKAGLIHLTRIMAVELGPYGIRVNSIAPGTFRTDMTADVFADHRWVSRRLRRIPLRRFGQPHDLAGLAIFLASPASDHITGQTIIIDGGASLLVG